MSASLNNTVRKSIAAAAASYYPVRGGIRARFLFAVRKGGKVERFLKLAEWGDYEFAHNSRQVEWEDRWLDYAISDLEKGNVVAAVRSLIHSLKHEGDEVVFTTKEAFEKLRILAA